MVSRSVVDPTKYLGGGNTDSARFPCFQADAASFSKPHRLQEIDRCGSLGKFSKESLQAVPVVHKTLGTIQSVTTSSRRILGRTILTAVINPSTVFQKNDLTVTLASALAANALGFQAPVFQGFCNQPPLYNLSALPCLAANHADSTTSYSWNNTAPWSLSLIQAAQPIK